MTLPFNPVPKPKHPRNKPTAAQRGAVTNNVRKELHYRSQGLCERCGRGGVSLEAAHLTRRWKIEGSTTISDLCHLCKTCHTWADTTKLGREWLESFKEGLRK